jgi:benzoate membrane transport protein
VVGVIYGGFYRVVAVLAAPLAGLFIAMPSTALAAVTGLALIAPLTGSFQGMIGQTASRDASVLAFAATASGLTLFGVGSAFWGLVAGFSALAAGRWIRPPARSS